MKEILYVLMILICVSFVNAMGNPASAYCEDMGYITEQIIEINGSRANCVFNDGNKCDDWEFYRGECGQEYARDISCRKLGEAVFSDFEECCEGGYVYAPHGLIGGMIGQSSCQKFSKVFMDNLKFLNTTYLLIIILILVIGYIIYKKYKK